MIHLAIFASGGGSNALKIIEYFKNHPTIRVSLIICNNPEAKVIDIAGKENIPFLVVNKEKFYTTDFTIHFLKENNIDFIILAGFLWLIPSKLILEYPDRILNIHPSLLPLYGGKGMYGHFVHEAVKANHEQKTGMTIHLVNNKYDEGKILFQISCPIEENMTAGEIAGEVLKLEHLYYSKVIEDYIFAFDSDERTGVR